MIRCAYARAVTLEQAAREVCAAANLPPPDLRRAGDPPEYADALLRRTFVSFPGRAPALPPDASLAQHCDADETIARALSHLFRARSHPNNVLCYGARRLGPNPPASARVSLGGAVASRGANIPPGDRDRAPPAAATETSARARAAARRGGDAPIRRARGAPPPAWRVFAARAGDDVFFHLLTNASVFARRTPPSAPGRGRGARPAVRAPVSGSPSPPAAPPSPRLASRRAGARPTSRDARNAAAARTAAVDRRWTRRPAVTWGGRAATGGGGTVAEPARGTEGRRRKKKVPTLGRLIRRGKTRERRRARKTPEGRPRPDRTRTTSPSSGRRRLP